VCHGHAGGCTVCTEYYGYALAAQSLWREKARRCNLPLSTGKGHEVAQGGAFTGIHLDTLSGTRSMLPEKASAALCLMTSELAAHMTSARRLARLRGKCIHYGGAAVQFLSFAAPSLSQAIHGTKDAAAIGSTPSMQEETLVQLQYDAAMQLSLRAARAIILAIGALSDFVPRGLPMWPLVAASSLYG
jgi:hypothetical protein